MCGLYIKEGMIFRTKDGALRYAYILEVEDDNVIFFDLDYYDTELDVGSFGVVTLDRESFEDRYEGICWTLRYKTRG